MDTLTWTELTQPAGVQRPEPRSWHSLTAISDDELILFGGLSNSCEPLKDCWRYRISSNTWDIRSVRHVVPNEPRLWHTAVFSPLDKEILIYGGGTQNILNYRLTSVYPNDLITLRFSPRSLLRLTLDSAVKYRKWLAPGYLDLPHHLRQLIKDRQASQLNQVELAGS